MTEPELLTSGADPRLPRAARRAVPIGLGLASLTAVIVLVVQSSASRPDHHRTAQPVATPVALPATGRGGPAAPVAADLARVLLNPARHRMRLIFTIFNAQSSRVVLLHLAPEGHGLAVRGRSFARFAATGSLSRVRLPLVLAPAQSAHVTLDYGVRRCPPANAARLRVPAVLATRERGRITVDLADLISPRDWSRGLVTVLCPISSR